MKKNAWMTLFLFLLVASTVFGQTIPMVKIEAPEVVAEVNGDKIFRSGLAAECLQLHGQRELQELIDSTLVRQECARQKIMVTAEEINDEIHRTAKAAGMTSEAWLQWLQERHNISPEHYRLSVIWQILALRKLASSRITVSEAELREAYDAQYGPAVQARQIVCPSRKEAEATLAELQQHPEIFSAVARNRSICPATAPYGGKLRPIRRGSFDNPEVEKMLLAMKPGELSPVIELYEGHFHIFLCESRLDPVDVNINDVIPQLDFEIRNKKQRQVAANVFVGLQNQAKVQIVFNHPALSPQYPGVAAHVNGQVILQQELAEVCVQKHGKEVLADMMNRLLVAQACKRERIIIGEGDIDNEIRDMASKHVADNPDGSANIGLWLKLATEETGLSTPMYRKNVVVPVLSLKRLTRAQVVVTEQDVLRSFEANYGRKMQCLAIYFREGDQRRAQEVWQKANQHKTEENFGDLAEKYSFDPYTRGGRGVMMPIAKHCGQPELEKTAFTLKPGELSEIIQVEDYLVILYCLGSVEPLSVKIEEVRADLEANFFEKKQQKVVARYFDRLYEQATLTNYLTGEVQNPALDKAEREGQTLQR